MTQNIKSKIVVNKKAKLAKITGMEDEGYINKIKKSKEKKSKVK